MGTMSIANSSSASPHAYSLAGVAITRPNRVWASGITFVPMSMSLAHMDGEADADASHRRRPHRVTIQTAGERRMRTGSMGSVPHRGFR